MAQSSSIPPTRELDFASDAAAAVLAQSPRGARLLLWGVLTCLGVGLTWAALAPLDEVTHGEGKVIPSRQIQVIQNLEGGILAEILVREGEQVAENQILLRIDDTRFTSSLRESAAERLALAAKVARLQAEATGAAFHAPAEIQAERPELLAQELALFSSRKQELASTLGILEQQAAQARQELAAARAQRAQSARSLVLVQKEYAVTQPLVKDGAISEVEVLRLERELNELKGEIEAAAIAAQKAGAKLEENERKVQEATLEFRNKAHVELNEAQAELDQLTASKVALSDRVARTAVRSPVRGTVKQIKVNTVGGVIQPGADLIEIVPLDDSLLIEARVRPADIAFLHPGQEATVKFSAYDYAIYGGLAGRLEHISADTIADEQGKDNEAFYLVRVRTERNHLGAAERSLPIIPGMVARVDILTGKKTVLDYLLKPVLRAQAYALRER